MGENNNNIIDISQIFLNLIHLQKRGADLGMQGPAQHSLEWTLHSDGVQLFRYINIHCLMP